jgi:hypothetical protein
MAREAHRVGGDRRTPGSNDSTWAHVVLVIRAVLDVAVRTRML